MCTIESDLHFNEKYKFNLRKAFHTDILFSYCMCHAVTDFENFTD